MRNQRIWRENELRSISISEYLLALFEKARPSDGAVCFMDPKPSLHFGLDGTGTRQAFLSMSDVLNGANANEEYSCQLNLLLSELSGMDAFVSFSSFKGGRYVRRDTAHLANVYAWSIDLDYVNEDIPPEDYLTYVLDNVSIPKPSFVEMGHRLRLIYVFSEPLRLCKPKQKEKLLSAFRFMQKTIADMINDELSFGDRSFGAESNPPTSFFRLPGGINSKDGSVIRVLPFSEERYSLSEIYEEFIPYRYLDASGTKKEWYESWKRKAKSKKKKTPYGSIRSLWLKRMDYLKEARTFQEVHRKKLCFVYACGCMHAGLAASFEQLLPLVMEFNEGFERPLPFNKLYAVIHGVPRNPYKFSNAYLSEFLEIPMEEIPGPSKKDYDHDRYLQKKKQMELNGTTKQAKISKRKLQVQKLLSQGKSLPEISRLLKTSLSTIKRDAKNLKETAGVSLIPPLEVSDPPKNTTTEWTRHTQENQIPATSENQICVSWFINVWMAEGDETSRSVPPSTGRNQLHENVLCHPAITGYFSSG